MRYRTLLVTGTDTGVGKTTVSCLLINSLRARGLEVGVMKPAETGCAASGGDLIAADAVALQKAAASKLPIDEICPYRFAEPLAPLLAGRRAAVAIELGRLEDRLRRTERDHDITLVEGAGGLLVPITSDTTYAEWGARQGCLMVLVVASKLGCINHTLMSLRCAAQAGLAVAGYVLNFPCPGSDLATGTNLELLTELAGPPLAIVPYQADPGALDVQLDGLLQPSR